MMNTVQFSATDRTEALSNAYRVLASVHEKLVDPSIPERLRMLSYLRICCCVVVSLRRVGLEVAPSLDAKTPYLSLLAALARRDAQWWQRCTIVSSGYLDSNDAVIQRLVQPLNRLVAQFSDHDVAA